MKTLGGICIESALGIFPISYRKLERDQVSSFKICLRVRNRRHLELHVHRTAIPPEFMILILEYVFCFYGGFFALCMDV